MLYAASFRLRRLNKLIYPDQKTNMNLSRNFAVDALRGTAIVLVLLLHFALAYGLRDSPLGILPKPLLLAFARNGNYGVTIFFTISGFLITTNALRRWNSPADIDLRDFYVLRLARIMPPLLLALLVIVALGTAGVPYFSNTDGDHLLPASHFWIGAGSVLTFWHNLLMQKIGYFNYSLNIYWSLSVEEVFYVAMPLLCLLLRRGWLLVGVCLGAIVAGPFYRAAHAGDELYFMYGYFACFDAIALGCLSAVLARRRPVEKRYARVLRVLAGGAIAVLYLQGIAGHEVFGFSLVALASAVFLYAAPAVSGAPGRVTAALGWLGRHSYELYLFHIIVLGLMRNVIERPGLSYATRLPWLLTFLGASMVLAALVARYVSTPANTALRRRFLRAGASLPLPSTSPASRQ